MNTEVMIENKPKRLFSRNNIWGKLLVLTNLLPLLFGFGWTIIDANQASISFGDLLLNEVFTILFYMIIDFPALGIFIGGVSAALTVISLVKKESKIWPVIGLTLGLIYIIFLSYLRFPFRILI